ncbi:hypothetical protein ACHJH3_04175 [Campylobacter sp. MOP7]|uniref:hypothetical protein n=1 Tax=Campylobacter canis TaxID=3378588 RepID=UPI00387E9F14
MKLSLPLIISALIVSAALAADTSFKESVYLEAKMLDEKFNIDKDIILAYAKTETDFQPYVIAIKTKTPDFTHWVLQQVGYKAKKSKNLPYVSVFPVDVKSAEFLYDFMIMNKKALEIIDYDFGLMQLNTRTIAGYGIDQAGEKELYLDYKKNMLYGADII